jgi:membrane-bound lytic murein transglycosylase D
MVRAQSGRARGQAAQRTSPAREASAGDESSQLAQLREAAREEPPATVAEAAARAGTPLPEGLEADFAAQLQLSPLVVRITPRIAGELVRYRSEARARRSLGHWVRHAARYRARIEAILASEGLPMDLVWVVAAESGFDPNDVSHAGAVGLWQLMPDAARSYGLRLDAWVDERRDPERATRAAARYLRDLHARFHSWELALAAYNMGYNALLRAIRRYNSNDFETLSALEAGLPWETVHYVPRILAAAVAARNAGPFGLGDITPDAALAWDDVSLARSVPLEPLARALGVSVAALRALNPGMLGTRTPPADAEQPFVLHVPAGMQARAEAAVARLTLPPTRRYRVRHGESLGEIAARYGLDAARLLALSGFASEQRVVAGTEILVPDREPTDVASERPIVAMEEPATVPSGRRRVFYRVGQGDELAVVARALGVRLEELLAWNALDAAARLQSGMWLQAYLAGDAPTARVWELSEVELLRRGSEEFYDRTVAQDGRVRLRITVSDGDTMASVAARYGLSVGSLARINRRSRQSALRVGDTLVVYTAPERLQGSAPEEREEPAEGEPVTAPAEKRRAPARPGAAAR